MPFTKLIVRFDLAFAFYKSRHQNERQQSMRTLHAVLLTALLTGASTAGLMSLTRAGAYPADRSKSDADLEARLEALEGRTGAAPYAGSSRSGATVATTSASPRMMSAEHGGDAQAQAASEAAMQKLDSSFKAQRVSPTWANQTELAVLDALGSKEAAQMGVQLPKDVSVECRSTLCKIQAKYADDAAAADAFPVLAMDMAAQLPQTRRVTHYQPDGSVLVTIYGLR